MWNTQREEPIRDENHMVSINFLPFSLVASISLVLLLPLLYNFLCTQRQSAHFHVVFVCLFVCYCQPLLSVSVANR